MLKTQVEAGASGYSVAGGGQQGLFVKQVLKDSTAAKLFSLQEGACSLHRPPQGGARHSRGAPGDNLNHSPAGQ